MNTYTHIERNIYSKPTATLGLRYYVSVERRPASAQTKTFATLSTARKWRNAVESRHPKGHRGRKQIYPGHTTNERHLNRYHALRARGLCYACLAPSTTAYCPECTTIRKLKAKQNV